MTPVTVVPAIAAPALGEQVERLRADLDWRLENLSESAWRTRKGSDPEAIHDTRVASRRLAAVLSIWGCVLEERSRQRARRGLRDLRRALGGARELEVNLRLLNKLARRESLPARAALRPLQREMRRALVRVRSRAVHQTRGPRVGRIVAWVEESAADLEASLERSGDTLEQVVSQVSELRQAGAQSIDAALADGGDEALHRARIAVKKWRYALECRSAVDPRVDESDLGLLRELQRSLGVIHDRAVLRDLLDRRASRARKREAEPARHWRRLSRALERERKREVLRLRSLARPLATPSKAPLPRLASA